MVSSLECHGYKPCANQTSSYYNTGYSWPSFYFSFKHGNYSSHAAQRTRNAEYVPYNVHVFSLDWDLTC